MKATSVHLIVALSMLMACDKVSVARSSGGGSPSITIGCTPQCAGRECGSDNCGGTCGTCSGGFTCEAQGQCSLNPTSLWHVTIAQAVLSQRDGSNDSWDPSGGLPDPQICYTSVADPRNRGCSNALHDTLEPVWNLSATNMSATQLLQGISFKIEDVDDFFHDTVADCTWTPTAAQFRAGQAIGRCAGANITLRLQPF